jgi:S-methylmethionine-dependent homocysteine/selenocysteine methylase
MFIFENTKKNFLQASIEGFCKYLGVTTDAAQHLIQSSVTLAREACNEFWETQLKENPTSVS